MARDPMPQGWQPSSDQASFIRTAIKELSAVCDGAHAEDGKGFSAADADFGHKLAGLKVSWWTVPRYWAARNLALRYRGQLAGMGLDVAVLDVGLFAEAPTVRETVNVARPSNAAEIIKALDPVRRPSSEDLARKFLPSAEAIAQAYATPPAAKAPSEYDARGILGPGGVISRQLAGYESRPEQLALAELIEQAMDSGRNAVTEAGTGTGKSLAYLIPSILMSYRAPKPIDPNDEEAEAHRPRTIVSTADKSLQSQLWLKDVPFLKSVMPKPFTAALLKGRGNYLCLYQMGQAIERANSPMLDGFGFETREEAAHFPEVLAWSYETATGDLEELPFIVSGSLREAVAIDAEGCLSNHCPFFDQCWAERAKRKAKSADVIIVNHALLLRDLSLRLATGGHVGVLPEAEYVVIDEAHHIEEIATDAFGVELTAGQFHRMMRGLERLTIEHPEIVKQAKADEAGEEVARANEYGKLGEILTTLVEAWYAGLRTRMERAGATVQIMGDDVELVRPAAVAILDMVSDMKQSTPYWLKDGAERERWAKLADRLDKYGASLFQASTPDPENNSVRYAELTGDGAKARTVVHVKPIDVSELLRAGLFESESFEAVIATSATIATEGARPFGFWTDRVGCDDPLTLQVGAPFDYSRHALLYLPADGKAFDPTLARQDGSVEYLDRLANEYERLILASRGRAFALFTSFRTLNEVYRRLSPRLIGSFTILKQGEMSRPDLVARFKSDGNAVLFGVKSFWEGVDVQGEALSMVIIDKLPFTPPDDPVWRARQDALTRKTGDQWAWFNQLAIPNTIIALKQGFGRLIRTKEDRGTVAILDGRLSTKPYGTRVIRALPPATPTRSIDAVRAFYS